MLQYGAVVASYGLYATLVVDSDTTEYRKHGDKRFGLVAKDLLFPEDGSKPHAYKAEVLLDEKVIDRREHGYVLASLVSNWRRPLPFRLRANQWMESYEWCILGH